ncbi:MAG: 50S ribosomal protein L29 [Candidatus Saccharimonadota bacterium]
MADVTKKTTKSTTKAKAPVKKAAEVKTLAQLQEELVTLQADQLESQRSHRAGELVNPHVITVQRKSIARTKTLIRQAEIAAAKEEN